jgi:hypothetical protein
MTRNNHFGLFRNAGLCILSVLSTATAYGIEPQTSSTCSYLKVRDVDTAYCFKGSVIGSPNLLSSSFDGQREFFFCEPDSTDKFGYTWEDSRRDTIDFEWIEVKDIGERIDNPGDDFNYGPWNLGHDFPFYTGYFNSYRICTNGWLSFTSSSRIPVPQPIPTRGAPDNLIAPFWKDLDPSRGGDIFTWSSSDRDSSIIEFHRVPSCGGDGEYTFEIVLTEKGDIGLQYLSMEGDTDSVSVGIEGPYGRDGLKISYLEPFIEDSLRIQLYRPVADSLDAGVIEIPSPRFQVFFDDSVELSATLFNYGTRDSILCPARISIESLTTGLTVFSREEQLILGESFSETHMHFLEKWYPGELDSFLLSVRTCAEGDMRNMNDTLTARLYSVDMTFDTAISYDTGNAANGWAFLNQGGIWAVRFTPEQYPCRVIGAAARFWEGWPDTLYHDVLVCLFDDNGPEGSPGDLLAGPFITNTEAGWDTLPFPDRTKIEEGDFYLGIMQELVFPNCNGICVDDTTDGARSWKRDPLSDEWLPLGGEYGDLLIRALVSHSTRSEFVRVTARSICNGLLLKWNSLSDAAAYNVYLDAPSSNNLVTLTAEPTAETTFLDRSAVSGTSRTYRIGSIRSDRSEVLSSSWTFRYDPPGKTGEEGFELLPPCPNPCNPVTQIRFRIPVGTGKVRLRIYDLRGRPVRTLCTGESIPAGMHTILWDGMDDHGRTMSTGVYIIRLEGTGGTSDTDRILLIR